MVMHLVLPWPPTMNTLYPSGATRRFLSKKGKRYQEEFRAAVTRQVGMAPRSVMSGRVAYRIRMMPPDRRRRDLSNHLKAVEDNLTKCGVWADDSLVDDGHFTRGPIVKGGRVEIEIWEIPEPKETNDQA